MSERKKVKIEFDQVTAWKIATIVLGVLFIISLATGGFRGSSGSDPTKIAAPAPTPTAAPQPTEAPAPQYVEISEGNNPSIGDNNAPVTIVEFSDYQCPFCARFYTNTLGEIKEKYIDTGKVRLVYRDLPLPFHSKAEPAAIAAECADEQGQYFKYHDWLFENSGTWSSAADTTAAFIDAAGILGLDESEFTSCLDDPSIKQEVQDDYAYAGSVGATGTPTFFINGRKVVGAQPTQVFAQIIEDELKKA